jgi:hypothetical protein
MGTLGLFAFRAIDRGTILEEFSPAILGAKQAITPDRLSFPTLDTLGLKWLFSPLVPINLETCP